MDVSVKDPPYNAAGDASTDDHAAIQAAIDQSGGGTVHMPDGHYMVSRSLYLRKGTKLVGHHAPCWLPGSYRRPLIQARSDFVGDGVINIHTRTVTGHPAAPSGGLIQGVCVSGNNVGSTVQGIYFLGEANDWTLRDVEILDCKGSGLRSSGYNFEPNHGLNLWHVHTAGCGNSGFLFVGRSYDHRLEGTVAHNNSGAGGYTIENSQPSAIEFNATRSEWNSGSGYIVLSGDKITFNGAITDRNNQNGWWISTSVEEGPCALVGCYANRDGRASNVYAGVRVHNSNPVHIAGLTVREGFDDGGGGLNSPKYGVQVTGSSVVLVQGWLAGATAGFNKDATAVVKFSGTSALSTPSGLTWQAPTA
jgi:pectate lyase-like protein